MTARGSKALDQQERFNALFVDAENIIQRLNRERKQPPKAFLTTLLKLMAGYLDLCVQVDQEISSYSQREQAHVLELRAAIEPTLNRLQVWIAALP